MRQRYPIQDGKPSRRTQPDWMRSVKVGDVLEFPSGDQRVVRDCSFFRNGDLHTVTFAIRHCSWTGSCSTVLNYTDLKSRGAGPTGVTVTLRRKLDREFARNMDISNRRNRTLDCCDVKGVP